MNDNVHPNEYIRDKNNMKTEDKVMKMQEKIDSIITKMSLRDRIGQMLIAKYSVKDDTVKLIKNGYGGIWPIFHIFKNSELEAIRTDFKEMNSYSKIPLLVSADLEVGCAQFCHDGSCTEFPSLMAFGAVADNKRAVQLAYIAGKIMAEEAAMLGINITPSPVVDVNTNPTNPISNTRSAGDDPAKVAQITSSLIEGMQSTGKLIAMAKHFPGEGMHQFDPHFDLEKMQVKLEEMEQIHLVPFIESIKVGVGCIMTNHAIYEPYDAEFPVTLSYKIITGLLRNKLGYSGLIMTDAMQMKGITARYGNDEALIMAVEAGNDIILGPVKQETAIDVLERSVIDGRIPESRINESLVRIIRAKLKLGLFDNQDETYTVIPKSIRQEAAVQLARESITLVKNNSGIIPMSIEGKCFLVVEPEHPAGKIDYGLKMASTTLYDVLSSKCHNIDIAMYSANPTESEIKHIAMESKAYDAVFVGTSFFSMAGQVGLLTNAQVELVKEICIANPTTTVIAANPYVIAELPFAQTVLVNYGVSKVSVEAAFDVIFGSIEAKGVIPVILPERIDASSIVISSH